MKDQIIQAFTEFYQDLVAKLPTLGVGLVLLIVFIFIGLLFRRLFRRRIAPKMEDRLLGNFISRLIFLLFLLFGIIVFLNKAGLGDIAQSLLAGAGVTAIILGFAFRDIGENLLSGVFLAFGRPFGIGDVIEVNDIMGVVRGLDLRNTHVRSFDGRDIFIPNSILVKNPLTNYTRDGLMRHDFDVGIDYGEDVVEATQSILNMLKDHPNLEKSAGLEPFVTISKFDTSTINLKTYFWINTFDFEGSMLKLKSQVMTQVVRGLIKEGYNLPADIIELKMYQQQQPIPIDVQLTGQQRKNST